MQYNSLLGFSGINRQVSHLIHETGEYAEAQNFTTPKIGVLKKAFDYQIKAFIPPISGSPVASSGMIV